MKKRILFLIPTLMHGGAERVLVNLTNSLDTDKYDITLQSIFDCGINKKYLSSHVKYKYNFKIVFRGNTHIMKLFSPSFLYDLLIKDKYDIIVSFLEGPTARILSGCPFLDTKKVAWIHIEQHDKKRFSQSFRNYDEAISVYEKFDKIICVSKTVKDDFDKLSKLGHKSQVLYNVNNTDYIKNRAKETVDDYNFDDNIYTFCSVAKITHTKGYERLLKVHKKLISEGLKHKIVILGTGEDENKIKLMSKREKVDDTFTLLGFKENPYKYIINSDCYICSSYREGFSTAVTEALVLGLPCISTNCSGALELLGYNNEYGIVTDNSDEGIYRGMKLILESLDLQIKYKELAKNRGAMFATKNVVLEVERMLQRLLDDNK